MTGFGLFARESTAPRCHCDTCLTGRFFVKGIIGILKSNREKEEDLVAAGILGGTGICPSFPVDGLDAHPTKT